MQPEKVTKLFSTTFARADAIHVKCRANHVDGAASHAGQHLSSLSKSECDIIETYVKRTCAYRASRIRPPCAIKRPSVLPVNTRYRNCNSASRTLRIIVKAVINRALIVDIKLFFQET